MPWGFSSTQGTILAGGKDDLCHKDGECSCFSDHTVLSSGSLLARLRVALWVSTSSTLQLLGPMVLPPSMFWLHDAEVISPAAKLLSLLIWVLLNSDAGVSW